MREAGAPVHGVEPAVVPIEGFALSPQQQRLWETAAPGDPAYRCECLIAVDDCRPAAAAAAIARLARAHEILRTRFDQRDPTAPPLQIVDAEARAFVAHVDLSALRDDLHGLALEAAREDMGRWPFDVARDQPLRALIARMAPLTLRVLFSLPSLCADAATMTLLYADFARLVRGNSAGARTGPEYADAAEWQNELLQSEAAAAGRDYWSERSGRDGIAPFAFESAPSGSSSGSRPSHRLRIRLPDDVRVRLDDRVDGVDRARWPLRTTLLTCTAIILRWLGGTDQVRVQWQSEGRRFPELRQVAGPFAKDLPLLVAFERDDRVCDLLSRVGEAIGAAEEWHEAYGGPMADEIAPDGVPAPHCEFHDLAGPAGTDGCRLLDRRRLAGRPRLQVSWTRDDDGLAVTLTYDPERFTRGDVERIAEEIESTVRAVAGHSDREVDGLACVGPREHAWQLATLNARAPLTDRAVSVLEQFEAFAAARPADIAVTGPDRELDAGALNDAAEDLADDLRALGVSHETPVGVLLERSATFIAAILGIWKAGGAYVPLDPGQPDARLEMMRGAARVSVIVTRERWRGRLTSARVVTVDGPGLAAPRSRTRTGTQTQMRSRRTTAPAGHHLAYVLFTSGSTGVPKAVMVDHRALAAYVRGVRAALALDECRSWATVSSPAADLGNTAIFAALVTGARLQVVADDVANDGRALAEYLVRHRIEGVKLTPSHATLLLSAATSAALPCRTLVVGGEVLSWTLVDALRRLAPSSTICNHYGPTETTVGACVRIVAPGASRRGSSVPLGRPLPHAATYILDRQGRAAPFGGVGELCIGGLGVARGYAHDPALTAERFIPDAFGESGGRLYRTGDLARYGANGVLEFLGRRDDQIKVRGVRIEPAEIEAHLAAHPAVGQCAVALREIGPDHAVLTAYVTSPDARPIDTDDLRVFLRQRVPDVMVPSAFVVMPALPLTRSGKIDRRALPPPGAMAAEAVPAAEGPSTPVEELLSAIWCDLLRIPAVGRDQTFFDAGGHSLIATPLVARIEAAFGVELPLRELFETPTIAGLAASIERRRWTAAHEDLPAVPRVDRVRDLPLSFAQERLWFLEQLAPGRASYHVPVAIRMTGRLNVAALRRSLNHVVARHEVLRTTFVLRDGRPVQAIAPAAPMDVPLVDLRELPDRERAVACLQTEHARRLFDLCRGPLMRVLLLQTGDAEHLLLLNHHHIIVDGWSASVLVRETSACYEAFTSGRAPDLPALPIQYADFACWQREALTGAPLQRMIAYWRRQLADAPRLEPPSDRTPSIEHAMEGATESFLLHASVMAAVRRICRDAQVTPFMFFVAAFKVLMLRSTGQTDICIGTPVANRTRPELGGLVGFFANTLALRTRVDWSLTFADLLRRVRETALDAYAHQDLPFGRVVEELRPERDSMRHPFFSVVLQYDNTPLPASRLGDVLLERVPAEPPDAKFDLSFLLREGEAAIQARVEYRTALFTRDAIGRLIDRFRRLVDAAAAAPGARISDLPWLAPAEQRDAVAVATGPARAYPAALIHERFASQAAAAPEAVAVRAGAVAVTYADLNTRANRLAHALRARGVGLETCVGVCLERSVELVVALLGILKAGAAYVPLEPAYPARRLQEMTEEAAVRVIVTRTAYIDTLPAGAETLDIASIDAGIDDTSAWPSSDPASGARADTLAYVIFTSGSTGRPKGAMNTHAGLANRIEWMRETFTLTAGDHVLQKTPISFDVSMWELLSPLAAGAELVMARPGGHQDSAYLRGVIEQQGITTVHFVPSMLQAFLRAEPETRWDHVRRVIVSGEALSDALQEQFIRLAARPLHNLYGPTEASIEVTWWPCDADRPVRLGRPIANVQTCVLDAAGTLVPPGIVGELHLGGIAVGRGYAGRPDRTAEKFVPNAYGPPGSRLYRTGDLARYDDTGAIEFLGRRDEQVKIRGFRVELGDVTAAVRQCRGVADAIVLARREADDLRLIAYVIETPEGAGGVSMLRRRLKEQVPDYLVPSAFVFLDRWPLTTNGKLDRQALPSPGDTRPALSAGYVAPRTAVEGVLASIWCNALGLQEVGIHDNFFDLGGHSLLATRIAAAAHDALGVTLPLPLIFDTPTIAGLAPHLDSALAPGRDVSSTPVLQQAQTAGEAPLSFSQQRLWFLHQLDPGDPSYTVSGAARLRGPLHVGALRQAFDAIVRRHASLRTTFATRDGVPVQIVTPCEGWTLPAIEMSSVQGNIERRVHDALAMLAAPPFDLAKGPLFRACVVRLADDDHAAILAMHHIIADGWSVDVLVQDLATIYRALLDDRDSELDLEPLPATYGDYARWQRELLQGRAHHDLAAWWRRQLAGAPPLTLPIDRPRSALPTSHGASHLAPVPPAMLAAVRAMGRRDAATPFMVLLTAFMAVLADCTGHDDIVVGTDVANRTMSETEHIVGLFTNQLVLRARLDGNPTFREALARVRAVTLGAFAHQEMPLDLVVKAVAPGRDPGRTPLFQVLFVLQNPPMRPWELAGLELSSIDVPRTRAKFDLSLFLEPRAAGLDARWLYRSALFDASTVARLSDRYLTVLARALDAPDRELAGLLGDAREA